MAGERTVEVDPHRVVRWVTGFGRRHGEPTFGRDGDSVVLEAPDGATAVLSTWPGARDAVVHGLADLEDWSRPPTRLGLVLVRRGGYAVGTAQDADLVTHKTGTRYVQSRTAAGGWSQQRFARRRGNQADELVGAVTEHVRRLVLPAHVDGLVLGGDRALAAQVLKDPRLAHLADASRRELYDLPDPRLRVLEEALRRGRAVRIKISDPS